MASTYSTSLKIQEIGNGEQSGIWGSTTNTNWTLIEQAVAGVQTVTMANSNRTLTDLNGLLDEARNMVLVVNGINSGVYQVVAPLVSKMYVISNQTTGGFAISIGASSGSVVTIPNGVTAQVYCDGITGFYSAQTGSAGNFTVNGTLTASGLTDTGNMSISGTLGVTGATSLTSGAISGVMTAPTATAGTNTTQLATTAFVQTALASAAITGTINMWPTASAPTGYLLCTGTAVSRTTYATLYAVIGTTFGVGDGSTTFNLPNYTNRMPYGTTVGATGGSADAVVVSHTHSITDPGHQHNTSVTNSLLFPATAATTISYGGPGTYPATVFTMDNATTGISVNTAGVSGTNANLPPYLGINFIIKT
jgi:microcystin-dependent protein